MCFGRIKPNDKLSQESNDCAGPATNGDVDPNSKQTEEDDSLPEKIPPLLSVVSFMDQVRKI